MKMLAKNDLLGTWHLESWATSYSSSDQITLPFGDNPIGMIVYTNDNFMSASISRRDRTLFPANTAFRRSDPALLADAYLSYFHYAGRYTIEDNVVIHAVTQSLNPNFVGSKQLRRAELIGQTLLLSGVEDVAGITRTHKLVWHRKLQH